MHNDLGGGERLATGLPQQVDLLTERGPGMASCTPFLYFWVLCGEERHTEKLTGRVNCRNAELIHGRLWDYGHLV